MPFFKSKPNRANAAINSNNGSSTAGRDRSGYANASSIPSASTASIKGNDPTSNESAPPLAPTQSNYRLILRMLGLAWQFKLGTVRILSIQSFLLALRLIGLGFTGVAVDVLNHYLNPDKTVHWPLGIHAPYDWSVLAKVGAIGGIILLVASLRLVLDRTAWVWKARLVQDIVVHLRSRVFHKLERLSFRFFDANESGSIINRVTGDTQAVRAFIDMVMIEVLMMILSLVFFIGYMLSIHVTLTLLCVATTPLLIGLTIWFSKVVRPGYRRNRELFDKAVLVLSENVQGTHVVKGFSLQDEEEQKFARSNDAVTAQQRWIFWRISTFIPVIQFLPRLNMMLLLIYGGYLYGQGEIALGTGLVVFVGLLQQFSNQIGNVAQIANAAQRSMTGAQRVFEVLDTPLEIESPANPVRLPKAEGAVSFDHVTFSYKDRPANEPGHDLSEVSFDVQPGQTIALLGATGAGKSTLLSLIPRFYDPTQGTMRVDGRDVRDYDLDDLRKNVGIVFQESFLFSDTVAENIAFGHPEASREQIERAARIAAAHEFITEELEYGYDTVLAEAGGNLSGGQRQRLAIARAVLLEPPILLLDDPTAAIDPETENDILLAMNQAMEGRTTFVVAHRLSTLRRADQVVVLEAGQVIQVGTHDELMDERGHYRRAAKLQIPDQESRRLLGISEEGQQVTT